MKLELRVVDTSAVDFFTKAPAASPREFRVRYDAAGHVDLSWDFVDGAYDYEIESTQIRKGSSYSSRLSESDRRTFRVRARNRHGTGPWSDPIQVVWTADRARGDDSAHGPR